MDIRHLEYFSEVAKHLSFTKAANALHISQPSLSKAIKSIEDELSVPLFYRSSKQLELTDAGKAVLVNAKTVLEAFYGLTSELSDIMELKKGEISIGIPPIVGAAFFSKLISRFKERYPSIQIKLTEVGTNKIKQEIEEGILDIGLICNVPSHSDQFELVKVLNDPLLLIVHKNHPLAQKKKVHFSEIESQPFILYRKDFSLHDRIVEECNRHGFYPNVVCESSQKDFMIELVEAKLGIALLPSRICQDLHLRDLVALPLEDSTINLELGMIWKKNKYLSFGLREFIKVSKEYLFVKA